MAGDLTFTAELQDKISPTLKNIQREVGQVTTAFENFKSTIATIGFGALITGAIQYASAIDDVASSTGLATQFVVGFSKAFEQFGSSTEGALTGLSRFQNLLDDAAQGSKGAQETFARLGISLNDLRTLSEQDLLRKIIASLAALGPGAERTALAMTLFGRSANSIDFNGVNSNLDRLIEKNKQTASAIEAAAAAEEKFGVAMSTFKTSLLNALEPIAQFVASLNPEDINKFVKAIVDISIALGTIAGAAKVLSLIGAGFVAVKGYALAAAAGVTTLAGTFVSLKIMFGGLTKDIQKGTSVFDALGKTKDVFIQKRIPFLISGFKNLIPGVAGLSAAIYGLNTVVDVLTGKSLVGWLDEVGAKMSNLLGISYKTQEQKKKEAEAEAALQKQKDKQTSKSVDRPIKEAVTEQDKLNDSLDKEKIKLDQAVGSYKAIIKEQLDRFALQTRSLTQTEEQQLVEASALEAQSARLKAIAPLEEQIAQIKSKGNKATELEVKLLPELQNRIEKINEAYAQGESQRKQELDDRLRILGIIKDTAFELDLVAKGSRARETQLNSQKEFSRQTDLLALSEDQRMEVDRLYSAQQNYLTGIQPLLEQHAQLQERITLLKKLGNTDLAKEESQLEAIRKKIAELTGEYQASLPIEQQLLDNRRKRIDLNQLESFSLKTQIDLSRKLRDIDDQRAALTLNSLERSYQAIDIAARESAESELEAYAARYKISRLQIPQNVVDDFYKKASEGSLRLKQSQQGLYEQSRQFSTGWVKAYKEYAQAATDASKQAAAIFNKTVQGMEDLFVNFAKTGKFEWKRFVADLSEEILRSQLRELFSGIFGDMDKAMSSGQGFMGAIGKLLGFGGDTKGTRNNPMYTVEVGSGSMAGNTGGGGGGGGFWDSIKSIGSSIWDGVKSVGSAIGDIFSGGFGTGSGFGNLDFGGFFANGGTLGAGRWGIAGERGPELISGPANITPLQPMQVTYNINAVDALSFKQMIAQDPSFIHAVAQQGSRGMARR